MPHGGSEMKRVGPNDDDLGNTAVEVLMGYRYIKRNDKGEIVDFPVSKWARFNRYTIFARKWNDDTFRSHWLGAAETAILVFSRDGEKSYERIGLKANRPCAALMYHYGPKRLTKLWYSHIIPTVLLVRRTIMRTPRM